MLLAVSDGADEDLEEKQGGGEPPGTAPESHAESSSPPSSLPPPPRALQLADCRERAALLLRLRGPLTRLPGGVAQL